MQKELNKYNFNKKLLAFVTLFCFIGITFSLLLTNLHYQVFTNPDYQSACAINDQFNCETVANSPYSVFLSLPVAIWGAFGYIVMLTCVFFTIAARSKNAFICLFISSIVSVFTSILLALISYCIICSFCLYCSIIYLINLIIFFLCYLIKRSFTKQYEKITFKDFFSAPFNFLKENQYSSAALMFLFVCIFMMYPRYWYTEESQKSSSATGLTQEGFHWIGTKQAALVIEEFSDYLCPFCQNLHQQVRKLVNSFPDQVKVVHRQFPLDGACNPLLKGRNFHVGACRLAKAALCAGEKGKFWEMNDLLYKYGAKKIPAKEIIKLSSSDLNLNFSEIMNCVDNSVAIEKKLNKDLEDSVNLRINSTPSFLIDGKVYSGKIPAHALNKIKTK